jgi:hypothetical protein
VLRRPAGKVAASAPPLSFFISLPLSPLGQHLVRSRGRVAMAAREDGDGAAAGPLAGARVHPQVSSPLSFLCVGAPLPYPSRRPCGRGPASQAHCLSMLASRRHQRW